MRVLVVEDQIKIAQLIKRGLVQQSFAVDMCHDGEAALDLALGEPYDVIVMDRRLPGKYEGAELCKELRDRGVQAPVLMLTAKDTTRDKIDGLNSGADDYLVKPFDFDELVARLRALTRRPRAVQPVVLEVGDVRLDTSAKTVVRAGVSVQLAAKEFALLEFFMRHPRQVLSKQKIIDHVWDYDSVIIANNVEVYVRLLRNKIDRPFPAPPLIHTVKGMGYKFEVAT